VLQLAAAQQPGGLKDFNIKSPNHIEKNAINVPINYE